MRMQVEMKRLEVEEPVYAGELVRCVARLHNAGSVPLKSLRLLVAQPELLCCPSAAFLTSHLTSLSGERTSIAFCYFRLRKLKGSATGVAVL